MARDLLSAQKTVDVSPGVMLACKTSTISVNGFKICCILFVF